MASEQNLNTANHHVSKLFFIYNPIPCNLPSRQKNPLYTSNCVHKTDTQNQFHLTLAFNLNGYEKLLQIKVLLLFESRL